MPLYLTIVVIVAISVLASSPLSVSRAMLIAEETRCSFGEGLREVSLKRIGSGIGKSNRVKPDIAQEKT